MYVYIYIYIYTCIDKKQMPHFFLTKRCLSADRDPAVQFSIKSIRLCLRRYVKDGSLYACRGHNLTVSSHNFNSHNFKSRVSNPRTVAYLHFEMPFGNSNLPGARSIFPD